MDKLFNSPWVLRIVALLLSCLLFIFVRTDFEDNKNAGNEQVDIIKDVPLEVYYDDENFIVTGLPQTVNVKIEGPTPLVLSTKAKDFTVFVDLNHLTMGEHRVTLQYENISNKLEVSLDPDTININIEEKVTQEFRVDPEMNNRLIADDYELQGMSATPKTVFITGAKSTIDSISYVKATIKGELGLNASFEQEANVKVLDRDLNRLDVIISPEKVNVKVKIEEYSKEIPLVLNQVGKLQENVTVNTLELDAKTVRVTGSKTKLDLLDKITVDFDLSLLKESKGYDVTIKLPDGVKTITPKQIKVNATTKVIEKESIDNEVPLPETEDIDS